MSTNHIPHDWEEGRRLRGWELHQQGWSQTRIAEALGVHQGTVSRWIARGTEGGVEALYTRSAPGATARLSDEQKQQLLTLLKQGAEAHGFLGDVWTQARIARLIKQHFGVTYHRDHIGRLLRSLGWSIQQPQQQASQRDDDTIARWRDQSWAELKKRPATKNAHSSL